MKRARQHRMVLFKLSGLLVLFYMGQALFGQESILAAYERNFLRANLSGKIDILQDAAKDPSASEFIGNFYEFVLTYTLQNASLLGQDRDFITLIILASRGVGVSGHNSSIDTLWRVFFTFGNSAIRVEILNTMGVLKDKRTVETLDQYLGDQNLINIMTHGRGEGQSDMTSSPDYPAISACIAALKVLEDPASFPVLFETLTSGYPETIAREADQALDVIKGDFKPFLLEKIQGGYPEEKIAALRVGNRNSRLRDIDRGELAERSLEIGLDTIPGDKHDAQELAILRYIAIPILQDLQWTKATNLVIKHFYQVQKDYQNKDAAKKHLLEAISCLGAMGNSEAAQVLVMQLGLFNSQMEQTGNFDGEITLGAIQALGKIGDKIAFDYLLYISFLPYPDSIQLAAKEALNRLKW